MIPFVLQGVGLGFVGAAAPGPFQAYIISQALRLGWRRTLGAALAPLISDPPIILLVLLALSRIPPSMQHLMNIASGLIEQRVTTHQVAADESLQDIARRVYGSAPLWTVIADANDIGDPMAVDVGTVLVIPDIPPEQVHGMCKTRPKVLKAEFNAHV